MSRRNIGKQIRIVYSPQSEARLPNMIPQTGTEVRIDFHGMGTSSCNNSKIMNFLMILRLKTAQGCTQLGTKDDFIVLVFGERPGEVAATQEKLF